MREGMITSRRLGISCFDLAEPGWGGFEDSGGVNVVRGGHGES